MTSRRAARNASLALLLPLALTTAPPAVAPVAAAATSPTYRTAAELPDEVLALLPTNAAEAGLDYAPRLVAVTAPTRADRNRVASSGLDVTEHAGDDFVEVVLGSAAEEAALQALGLKYRVVTPDLVALEHQRLLADAVYFRANAVSPLPSGRTQYRVLDDFAAEIDALVAEHAGLAKRISVGRSVEDRDLVGIEIGEGVDEPEDGRPVMLMFGNHHAREWPSAEAPMEFAHDLLQTYAAGDARTRDLLARTRVIIVPVSNPDGFDASRTSGDVVDFNEFDEFDPLGGTGVILVTPGNAYKRKNCRIVDGQTQPAGGCVLISSPGGFGPGVDLNRNYGALWGGPGAQGRTPGPEGDGDLSTGTAAATYQGPSAFSEPETQAIRDLISTRQVTTLISNHTFGNLLLRPVGIQPSTIGPDGLPIGFSPDECFERADGLDDGMQALGLRMTAQTGYSNQFGWELYDTTGTTEDYSYNATGGYGFTFEIGPDEFHPPFEEYLLEYTGEAAAAQEVTSDNVADLTTAVGRDCGDAVEPTSLGGGLREAYFLALENAANTATHSVLTGRADDGAVIQVTRTGTFPLWDTSTVEDTVTTSMVVDGDAFTYHVNPSTRPFSDARAYEVPDSGTPAEYADTGDPESFTDSGEQDVPFDVAAGTDRLVLQLSGQLTNLDDYELELLSPDLVQLGNSINFGSDEEIVVERPSGLVPGEYVARITQANPASLASWTLTVQRGVLTVPASAPVLAESPRTTEQWLVTCTVDDELRATREVVVDRGGALDLGDFCVTATDPDPDPTDPPVDPQGPRVDRVEGDVRYATAAAASQRRFPASASVTRVVLARGDGDTGFPDAIAGIPFADDLVAPLLLTASGSLPSATEAELRRVLGSDGEVVVLGGPAAVAPAVTDRLEQLGYTVRRVFGADRIATSLAIADEIGAAASVLIATGYDFADALAAGPAATHTDGVVLLTRPDESDPRVVAELAERPAADVYAIGGPAARAYPQAEEVSGPDRYATAVAVSEEFFADPTQVGLALGTTFPDALSGGSFMAQADGPMLLTRGTTMPQVTREHVCTLDAVTQGWVFGGTAAITTAVEQALRVALAGTGCPA